MKTSSSSRIAQRGGASTWIFTGFAAVALFFLVTEHRAHLYDWLPFLLLGACLVMHLFHGHGRHGAHNADDAAPRPGEAQPPGAPSNPKVPPAPATNHHH